MSDLILFEAADGVGTLTINRAEKKNAMTYAMLGEFIETVAAAGDHPDVRVLIITGAPGVFCAGTDLADLASVPGEQRGLRGTATDRGRWWPIVECPVPVIGAIDGPRWAWGRNFRLNATCVSPRPTPGSHGTSCIGDWFPIPAPEAGCCLA